MSRSCGKCGGSGETKEECPSCEGNGHRDGDRDDPHTCFKCSGRGTIPKRCTRCGGSGQAHS